MPDLREVKEFLSDTFGYIIAIVVAIVVFIYVVSFQQIVGDSMSPTLVGGDVAILSKITYKLFLPKRNDIVALKTDDGKLYVKRIIGLPGEEVHFMNNILYIDGTAYSENFLEGDVETNNFMLRDICKKDECPDNKIPDGMYLVLGDNREDSLDSRDHSLGLVPKKNLIGKSIFRIWPLNRMGVTK